MARDIDFSAFNNEQLLSKVEGVTGRIKELKSAISLANKEMAILGGSAIDLSNNFNKVNSLVRSFNKLQSESTKMGRSLKDITKKRVEAEREVYSLNAKSTEVYQRQVKEQNALLSLLVEAEKLTGDDLEKQQTRIDKKREEIDQLREQGKIIRASSEESQVVLSAYADLEKTTIQVNNRFASMFDIIGGIAKEIPGLSALVEPFQEANDLVRQQSVQNKRLNEIYKDGVLNAEALTENKIIELGLAKNLLDENDNIQTGEKAIASLRDQGLLGALEKQDLLTTRFKAMGSAIQKSLLPLMIITTVAKALKAFANILTGSQARSVELARQFGISRDSAEVMRDRLEASEKTINKTYATMTKLIEAQTMLVDELDRGGTFSTETLDALTLMSQRMGVSAEAATKVTARSEAFGGSARENVDTIMQMNNELYNSGQSTATFGQLMTAVGEASGQVAASFGFSNKAIARAVNSTRRLGLNLTQARNISENLLDFESSIAAELEAELFLGRDINLDKARALALQGNITGATSEVMKITRGLTAEQRKSPIIMQALADVVGLSVDELQDAYLLETDRGRQVQEQIKNYQTYLKSIEAYRKQLNFTIKEEKELADLIEKQNDERHELSDTEKKRLDTLKKTEKEYQELLKAERARLGVADASAAQMADQVTAGEQLAAAMERVKDKFMELVGTGVLDKVVVLLTRFAEQGVRGLFGGVEDYEILPTGESSQDQVKAYVDNLIMEGQLDTARLAQLRTQAEEGGFDQKLDKYLENSLNTFKAEVLDSEGKIKSGVNLNTTQRDIRDIGVAIAQAQGLDPNQLDDFIIRPGQGIQKFNKDDIVIGGTNLFGGGNNSNVEKKLDAILAAIQAGGDVYIDGNKAGRAMVLGTQRLS